MNLSEYQLLSKEDVFKMYENVCEELDVMEMRKDFFKQELSETQQERDEAYDEISGLMEEIDTLKETLDSKDYC